MASWEWKPVGSGVQRVQYKVRQTCGSRRLKKIKLASDDLGKVQGPGMWQPKMTSTPRLKRGKRKCRKNTNKKQVTGNGRQAVYRIENKAHIIGKGKLKKLYSKYVFVG